MATYDPNVLSLDEIIQRVLRGSSPESVAGGLTQNEPPLTPLAPYHPPAIPFNQDVLGG